MSESTMTKRMAMIVLIVFGIGCVVVLTMLGVVVYFAYPLLIAALCLMIGMLIKWTVEWCIKNIHIFRLRERANKVSKKLKIDKGVNTIKQSIATLKKKDENAKEDSQVP